MSIFGQVHVKNDQYKFKGDFHHLDPHIPRSATPTTAGSCWGSPTRGT